MNKHKQTFTEIYDTNHWGNGSGGGSSPEATVEYRAFLKMFLRVYRIKTVVDYGCGDWQFSKLVDWTDIDYLGVDVVSSVIDFNQKNYATKNFAAGKIQFVRQEDWKLTERPNQLLILKDVLQHWSNHEITMFLMQVGKFFKYILITNTCNQTDHAEEIPEPKGCRPLSAQYSPLARFNPQIMLYYNTNPNDPKEISLITNP